MKLKIIILCLTSLLIFGCFGGCYPGEFESLVVNSSCLDVKAGCVPDRLEITNNCENDIIFTTINSDSENYEVYLMSSQYGTGWFEISELNPNCTYSDLGKDLVIEGKGRNTENYICNNIFIPKDSKVLVDNVKGAFEINSEDYSIKGNWK